MILVLAGTTEGREVISLLQQTNYNVSAAVISRYGADLLELKDGSEAAAGRLDRESFIRWIYTKNALAVVDATHPFAIKISRLAMQVTAELNIPYIRLERPAMTLPQHPLIKTIDQLEQLEEYFISGQTIFSTLGTNNLAELVAMSRRKTAHLVVRILPLAEKIGRCTDLGLSPEQIIACKGPFSKELNWQLYLHYGADLILTKESGSVGGTDSKIEAALELGRPVMVWSRPVLEYPVVVNSASEVIDYLRVLYGGFTNG